MGGRATHRGAGGGLRRLAAAGVRDEGRGAAGTSAGVASAELLAAFWAHVIRGRRANACWRWTGPFHCATERGKEGFRPYVPPWVRFQMLAHRFAWELQHGPLPPRMRLRNVASCRLQKECVNPAHLFLPFGESYFLAHVQVSRTTGCWSWTGTCDRGRPVMAVTHPVQTGRKQHPRLFAYEWHHGEALGARLLEMTCGADGCVNPRHMRALTLRDRFERHVNRRSGRFCRVCGTECWEWTGLRGEGGRGYGMLSNGRSGDRQAHRIAHRLFKGPIPKGLWVLHSCDWKACVNPDHLSLGTHRQNVEEARERGRLASGEGSPLSRATEQQIRLIRHLFWVRRWTAQEIARAHPDIPLTPGAIQQAAEGATWGALPDTAAVRRARESARRAGAVRSGRRPDPVVHIDLHRAWEQADVGVALTPDLVAAFATRVSGGSATACWEWTGDVGKRGYGRLRGRPFGLPDQAAHRLAYQLAHGTLPPTRIEQTCANVRCVNPAHLVALTLQRRLLAGIRKERGGCWLWTGGTQRGGYGSLGIQGAAGKVQILAHRAMYELLRGRIPDRQVLMHACDDRRCVNPDHLTPGTPDENIRDMLEKGRGGGQGHRNENAVLSGDLVLLMRHLSDHLHVPARRMAAMIGCHPTTAAGVIRRTRWRHVRERRITRSRMWAILDEHRLDGAVVGLVRG